MEFIRAIADRVFRDVFKIITETGKLSDNALLYVETLGNALGINIKKVDLFIDQIQYERRKELPKALLNF